LPHLQCVSACLLKIYSAYRNNEVKSSVDIGDGSSIEIVDEFCNLGHVLSVDGDADAAVTAGFAVID